MKQSLQNICILNKNAYQPKNLTNKHNYSSNIIFTQLRYKHKSLINY